MVVYQAFGSIEAKKMETDVASVALMHRVMRRRNVLRQRCVTNLELLQHHQRMLEMLLLDCLFAVIT